MIVRLARAALGLLALLPIVAADNSTTSGGTRYVTYTNPDQTTVYLADNRQPALYTQNFGDCMAGSTINVTRFDAAYYKDNMTVLFHLAGSSALYNESVMMFIGVYAYGESRFDLTFNPCHANIYNMCPLNSSIPISANGIIPVSADDVAGVPDIALSIPDFEGQAILRIFSNRTQQEIACYSAVVTNGATFSQPAGLGTVLGLFTLLAVVASVATAAYGEAVPTMRLHYAHSMSVGVVFAVFQHIFFTGALSMNWPSVLVAWWSNFAWAGGMIYDKGMQSSISKLIGNNIGSTISVGAAPVGISQPNLGGGYNIHQIYGRGLDLARSALPKNHPLLRDVASEIYDHPMMKRDVLADASTGYKWYGEPVGPGLPLPGNYSGFAGTLAVENLQISNAFLTGFLWFLILLLILIGSIAIIKGTLELFSKRRWMPATRLAFFRKHWLRYTGAIVLRACFIAWFMIMFLIIFQFTFESPASVKAIAAIVFVIFLIGLPALAYYACIYKAKRDGTSNNSEKGILKKIPFLHKKRSLPAEVELQSQAPPESKSSSKPFWRRVSSRLSVDIAEQAPAYSIHDDEDYIMKFGWLASRFRRTKWWFFTFWLFYEFIRACFYGGASGHPLVQVFGLLVVEILAFVFVLWVKPFEGRRLNVLVVYCLGFSKVTTVALSAAFDIQFNLERITTTAIGIVIIVIQGILMIITCIAIVVGAATSYMSVSRNRDDFRPRKYAALRERYFDHLDRVVNDLPPPPKPEPPPKEPEPEPEEPKEPYFEMKNMRRLAKIEDDDPDNIAVVDDQASRSSIGQRPFPAFDSRPGSQAGSSIGHRSRAPSAGSMSLRHGNLPYGARPHKASWSARDFESWNKDESNIVQTPIDMTRNVPDDTPATNALPPVVHTRSNSRSSNKQKQIRGRPSSESLQMRQDVHSRELDSSVPPPPSRPRDRSRESSGRASPTVGQFHRNFDGHGDSGDAVAGAPRRQASAKMPMLTPAQESEEFASYFEQNARRR